MMKEEKKFYSLTPIDDIKHLNEYYDAFSFAIGNENILNIAVSGTYGSGKSSVIKSCIKKAGKTNNTVFVSLAAFDYDKGQFNAESSEGKSAREAMESKLEEKILKQILYAGKPSKLAKSRFSRITDSFSIHDLGYSSVIALVLTFIIYRTCLDMITAITDFFPKTCPFLIYSSVAIVLFILITIIIFFAKSRGIVLEISLSNASIKNESKNSDRGSILNKNIDELLYFFEKTKKEIVVIEDLDRFNETSIFVSLREINALINNSPTTKPKVKFIYAVKDDLLTKDSERTKFFDFIIPVIPYISSSNSNEILYKELRISDKTGKSELFDLSDSFIYAISAYINDARTLLNIINEFAIMNSILKTSQQLDLKEENMFSLVVLKNLNPEEFAKLEQESDESMIINVFNNKEKFISEKDTLLQAKKSEEDAWLKDLKDGIFAEFKDLKLAWFNHYTGFEQEATIDIEGERYKLARVLDDGFDIKLLMNSNIYARNRYGAAINGQKEKASKYLERINRLSDSIEKAKSDSLERIREYKKMLERLNLYSIKEIIRDFYDEFSEYLPDNGLIVFLLKSGYLDENYKNYINYFYPNSKTKDEQNFVLSVHNLSGADNSEIKLPHAEQVFRSLMRPEFSQKEALNFDLLDYMFTAKSDTEELDLYLLQISNNSERSNAFIKAYLNKNRRYPELLIKAICNKNELFWETVEKDSEISADEQKDILCKIITHADVKDILNQDHNGTETEVGDLGEYILSLPDFFRVTKSVKPEKMIEVIKELGLVFGDVDIEEAHQAVKEFIFAENWYSLNFSMIEKLFEWKDPGKTYQLDKQNYTSILELGYEPLTNYVHNKFDEYIKDIILGIDSNFLDNAAAVKDMIERLFSDNIDLCIDVLNKEKVVFERLGDILPNVDAADKNKKIIWDYLIKNNRIVCNWNSVVDYYENYGCNDEWISYFERNYLTLVYEIDESYLPEELFYDLLKSIRSIDCFKALIKNLKEFKYDRHLDSLENNKIDILIEELILPFTDEYWEELGEISQELRIKYALANRDDFMNSIDELTIGEAEICCLLLNNKFTNDERSKILSRIEPEDITEKTANIIKTAHFNISKEYVESSFQILPIKDRCELLINHIHLFTKEELSDMFSELDEPYRKLTRNGKTHKYSLLSNDYNERLVGKLKEINYLTILSRESTLDSDGNESVMIIGNVKRK